MLEFFSLAMDRKHYDELLKLSGNGFASAIMYSSGTPRSFHHIFFYKKVVVVTYVLLLLYDVLLHWVPSNLFVYSCTFLIFVIG
jgi:hypothetical protein